MKEGYKKTELGWIPETWNISKFESIICRTELGTNSIGNDYIEGIPMIKMGNLKKGGFVLDKVENISEDEFQENKHYLLNKGDFLFNTRNTLELVGKSATWKGQIPKCIFNSNIMRVYFNESIDSYYMSYFFEFDLGWKQLKSISTGTTSVAAIYTKDLNKVKICVPPLKEQQKIAEILSTVDSQIDYTDKLIEKTKELKKGLMQRLLTKGIGHTEFKMTEIGEIPVGWEVKAIGELVDLLKSGLSRSLKEENVGIPCIRSNNIKDNRLILDDLKYWYEIDDKGANIEEYILKEGDIIINFINSISQIGKGCIFNRGDFRTIYTTNLLRIQVNKTIIINKFFHYYTQTERYKKEINLITKPAVNQASFTTVEYKAIKFPVPKLEEQEQISNILSSVDVQIEEYENNKAKLEELKKGLMQQLLTGKIRVKV